MGGDDEWGAPPIAKKKDVHETFIFFMVGR